MEFILNISNVQVCFCALPLSPFLFVLFHLEMAEKERVKFLCLENGACSYRDGPGGAHKQNIGKVPLGKHP